MNIGAVSSSMLQQTHQGHSAQGLQPNASPISQTESLTRVNSTQNTSSAENKPNSQQQGSQNADTQALQKQNQKNVKEYKRNDDPKEGKQKDEHHAAAGNNARELSEEDLQQVQELQARDREVRSHEAAHLAAAGQYAKGGVNFEYKKGPDGKSYAVGGHVNIDTSPVPNDPQATIRKANQIRAAAMAPADPSGQDRSVASQAAAMAAQARAELVQEQVNPEQSQTGSEVKVSHELEDKSADQPKPVVTPATSQYSKVANLNTLSGAADQPAFHQTA